jgi:hypothetical protein
MRIVRRNSSKWAWAILGFFVMTACLSRPLAAQSSYTAQLSGTVNDTSGGVIPGAKVILTDEGTGIGATFLTDRRGTYVFTGLRPAAFTIRVEAPGFKAQERKGVALAVSQQATLDFTLSPGEVTESVTVTEQAPLLDTGSATLGTDVTNEYLQDIPLINRSMFGLVFSAGGVTETTGSGITDTYPSGTNFVSNGQRNATAEVRVDGALTSAPEQGEGATSNVYYQPSVEIVQEFKVENNSFSAEYGNNGGTVVNMVLKSGTNNFHGSGWWYLQRAALDANDFFSNAQGQARPDHLRDQYGFSLGGPIRKQKTFFFVDYEKVRQDDPIVVKGTVPTDAMRNNGDFSQLSPRNITLYNPFDCTPAGSSNCTRSAVVGDASNGSLNGVANVIPQSLWDPVGKTILGLFPEPNVSGPDPTVDNFQKAILSSFPGYQFDIKVDQQFGQSQRLTGRYSRLHSENSVPFVLGSADFNDGMSGLTNVQNIGLEYTWSVTPTLVWVSRFAVDRAYAPVKPVMTPSTLEAAGFPSYLVQANGLDRMPAIVMDQNGNDRWLSMYTQCCTNTNFAHTLYSYSSALSWIHEEHTVKAGFEQRQFLNNFWQPNYPTGCFYFPQSITAQSPTDPLLTHGNSFATLLMGWADTSSGCPFASAMLNIVPSVADKSAETAFYGQDDWKVSSRLTINLGLRYEWSSPYTVRHNRQQYSDFTSSTGVSVTLPDASQPLLNTAPPNQATPTMLIGTTVYPFQQGTGRSVPTDRNNLAPRIGFAFSITPNTVIRGGAGVYYGMSPATNFQFPGTVYSAAGNAIFSSDSNATRNFAVTLSNPFPNGMPVPQGQKYGAVALWGYDNSNNVGLEEARAADIYQWNIGVQHLFPWEITIGVDYSANRSTHLPWGGYSSTRNRNFISSDLLAQLSARLHAQDPNCDDSSDNCVSSYLQQTIDNPFLTFFQGPAATYNEPAAIYNQAQLPLFYFLRPYPQFAGTFQALPKFSANSWYNSLQVRFQKRMNHYFSFEGNYTYSKATDDSSIGANAFVGNLNTVGGLTVGNPQQLDRLNKEWSVSANDATNRLVVAGIFQLPVGRGLWIGSDMNRVLDGFVGGWQLAGVYTYQTGQPLPVVMASARLQDGNQRPNIICSQLGSGFSYHTAAVNGLSQTGAATSVLNPNCFADPGDQNPGNAPRYNESIRADGIRNWDLSLMKQFTVHEGMTLQFRAEAFNLTNTTRFAFPNLGWAPGVPGIDSVFGQVTLQANSPRIMQLGLRFQF